MPHMIATSCHQHIYITRAHRRIFWKPHKRFLNPQREVPPKFGILEAFRKGGQFGISFLLRGERQEYLKRMGANIRLTADKKVREQRKKEEKEVGFLCAWHGAEEKIKKQRGAVNVGRVWKRAHRPHVVWALLKPYTTRPPHLHLTLALAFHDIGINQQSTSKKKSISIKIGKINQCRKKSMPPPLPPTQA